MNTPSPERESQSASGSIEQRVPTPQEVGASAVQAAIGENVVDVSDLQLTLITEASRGATTEKAAESMSLPVDEIVTMRDELIGAFNVPNMAAVISIAFSQKLIDFKERKVPAHISDRDVLILRLIAQGKANKEISQALGREPQATRNTCKNLYKKIGVTGRTHSVRRAYEYGIFTVY